jgi:hypothetical protein
VSELTELASCIHDGVPLVRVDEIAHWIIIRAERWGYDPHALTRDQYNHLCRELRGYGAPRTRAQTIRLFINGELDE